MKSWSYAAIAAVLFFGAAITHATLLFDNYLPNPDGGWDGVRSFPSEVDAVVGEQGAWAADDAVFDDDVRLDYITWLGARKTSDKYAYKVEVTILDPNFFELFHVPDLELEVLSEDPNDSYFGLTPYEGKVELTGGIELTAGHYYIAVRLVSRKASGELGGGRNLVFATNTGDPNHPTNPDGITEGAVYFPGGSAPHWTFISDYPGQTSTDYAYRIFGVPEPGSLVLLASGLLLMMRRR